MKEYELLRAEILDEFTAVRTYEVSMYTVVVAILAFTIDSDYYLACMLPYLVIVSVFFITTGKRSAIYKMGTYMMVFLEGKEYYWERRHHKYDKLYFDAKEGNLKWSSRVSYYLLASSCSFISILKLITGVQYSDKHKLIMSIVIGFFTIIIFILFYKHTSKHLKEKPKMIKRWKKIKEAEIKEKSKNPCNGISLVELTKNTDSALFKSFVELVLLTIESSETKEEAAEKINNLSIMKTVEQNEN